MLDRRNQVITTVLNGAGRSAAVPVGAYAQVMPEIDLSAVTFPRRLAVVNRGEAAVRLIRAVRELNAEYGCGITTVALHTDAERRAMFVRQADQAVTLRRTSAGIAYLDHDELERALLEAKADAVWVGWGFVAEDIAFAELCVRMNLTFIGPPPAAMRTLGDKVEAKFLAEKVGVPLAPWSRGPVETRADARRHAEAIGYPLIIKARSGGGGRGIRKVFADDELEVALERTQGEARALLRRPGRIHRTPRHRCTPRRGTDHGRQPRQCVGSRSARLLHPAQEPEGDRGVQLPGTHQGAGRPPSTRVHRTRPRGGILRCRHRRVPLSAGPEGLHLPRGQHPAAGRAPDHRGHHRHRPGEAADSRRRRRFARRRMPAGVRPRRRGPTQRRGRRQGVRPGAGDRAAAAVPARFGVARRHGYRAGRRHSARLRLDGRQGHRLGPGPQRSARAAAHRACARPPSSSTEAPPPSRSCSICSTAKRSSQHPPTPAGSIAPAPATRQCRRSWPTSR